MKTLHVLVVDDDPAIRRAIIRVMKNLSVYLPDSTQENVDFSMDEATTALEAQQLIQASPSDLLIIDNELSDDIGMNVIEYITQKKLDVITIMMSGYPSVETVVSATKHGAYDFLSKPFTPEELRASVRKAAKHLLLRRHARMLAEEKRRVRFQSISVLAHELKSPLASIEGYLRILKDKRAVKDELNYNRVIDRSLVRLDGMRKMITDLLDLTRIESGQKKREQVEFDLIEIVQTALEMASPTAYERHIELKLDSDSPVKMMGDRGEMEIIFNNLISNAVKYNRDNGSVTVRIAEEGGQISVGVSDTGIGMTPDETSHIFEEFYRVKNEKTKRILGSGLGLATVKKIVQLYGGSIDFHSEIDQGTTFQIRIPSGILREPVHMNSIFG